MSDQEMGKKMEESDHLDLFIAEYAHVAGIRLEYVDAGERPDFICEDRAGQRYGVELTQVRSDPCSRIAMQALTRDEFAMEPDEAVTRIMDAISAKELKRREPDWRLPDSTILVLDVMDANPDRMAIHLNRCAREDFADHGFLEVWISNHASVEPFGAATLFGLHPERYWGAHGHRFAWTKPYG